MPVSAPLMVMSKLQLLLPKVGSLLMIRELKAAKEAEIMVLTTDRLTDAPSPASLICNWDPPLNARKPKNKINPPKAAIYNKKGRILMRNYKSVNDHNKVRLTSV